MIRLVVGYGYVGHRVANRWLEQGDDVYVLTRSLDRATQLRAVGFRPLVGDVTDFATLPAFPRADTVLWAVGHDRLSGKSIHEVQVDGLCSLLASLTAGAGRVIYISSTGVYAQQDGDWVDESSPCRPRRAGGKACLAAEQHLQNSKWSGRAVILRFAGIYGAERLPQRKRIAAGRHLQSDPDTLLNLIHVQDAVAAVIRVADRPLPLPRIYLVADGHPVLRRTFYEQLARQTHAPCPVFDPPAASPAAEDRSGSHKRVANGRMLSELGVNLCYPSFREGLAAVAHATE